MRPNCTDRLVGDFGEKEFISVVLGKFADTAMAGKFEDCMVVDLGGSALERQVVVINVDHPSFIGDRFDTVDDYRFYGRWVAAGTCGDVVSMGVRPSGFALDLSVPVDMRVSAVEAVYEGICTVLDEYGATLSGGNVDRGPLEVVGVAWGTGSRDRLVRRCGANAGDHVLVTCDLGRGWAGYLMNHYGHRDRIPVGLLTEADAYHEHARAPVEPILECAEAGIITSGMDLSDGVLEFCYTIQNRNNLGVLVYESEIGGHALVHRAGEVLGLRPGLFALEPGYDFPYAHGYTIAADALDTAFEIFARHQKTCTVIGTVTSSRGVNLRTVDGRIVALPPYWADQTDQGDDRVRCWRKLVSAL